MIILEVVSAAGGLCGALALLHQNGERRARRRQLARRLDGLLRRWEGLSSAEQEAGRAERHDRDQERAYNAAFYDSDPSCILDEIRHALTALAPSRHRSAVGDAQSLSALSVQDHGRRSVRALVEAARLALQAQSHD
jgi:hypothetical protein